VKNGNKKEKEEKRKGKEKRGKQKRRGGKERKKEREEDREKARPSFIIWDRVTKGQGQKRGKKKSIYQMSESLSPPSSKESSLTLTLDNSKLLLSLLLSTNGVVSTKCDLRLVRL